MPFIMPLQEFAFLQRHYEIPASEYLNFLIVGVCDVHRACLWTRFYKMIRLSRWTEWSWGLRVSHWWQKTSAKITGDLNKHYLFWNRNYLSLRHQVFGFRSERFDWKIYWHQGRLFSISWCICSDFAGNGSSLKGFPVWQW